jgi:RecB family endonuclease NucS
MNQQYVKTVRIIDYFSSSILKVICLTRYFRHLKEIFKKAGIEVTSENKREIDRIIHSIVGVEYKNCPDAWKEVKKRIAENEAQFVSMLKTAWNKQK